MPDTMIATADTAEVLPKSKSLGALLKEYRKTFREWNAALAGDYDGDMADEQSRVYQDAAGAPCRAAIDAMIEAPVVSLEDIATKLRFYFLVVKDGDAGVDPNSWEEDHQQHPPRHRADDGRQDLAMSARAHPEQRHGAGGDPSGAAPPPPPPITCHVHAQECRAWPASRSSTWSDTRA